MIKAVFEIVNLVSNKQVEREEELEAGRMILEILQLFRHEDLDQNDDSGIEKSGGYGYKRHYKGRIGNTC